MSNQIDSEQRLDPQITSQISIAQPNGSIEFILWNDKVITATKYVDTGARDRCGLQVERADYLGHVDESAIEALGIASEVVIRLLGA